jgi:GLPGLI family protein
MFNRLVFGAILMLGIHPGIRAQKEISEGAITYEISITSGGQASQQISNALKGAKTILYIKGANFRTDMITGMGTEKTIYHGATGSGVILKEYSGQKLMITLTKEDWADKNQRVNELRYQKTEETKSILGYTCTKGTATMGDGSAICVYYTSDLTLANREYDPTFKTLPGIPMQYEMIKNGITFTYTATNIDLGPVTASLFDIPRSGYRTISYAENNKSRKDGN